MKLLCALGLLSLYFAAEQTTEAQKTTVAPKPAAGNLYYYKTENGTVCILLRVDMEFNFTYAQTDNTNGTMQYSLPDNETVEITGSCQENGQFIALTFAPQNENTKFTIRMNFDQDDKTKEQYVSDIILDYTMTEALFPGANETGKMRANATGEFFKVSESNQYLCKSNVTQVLSNSVQMLTSELNLQAYRDTDSLDFKGDRQQCQADAETNNIVPIAVGAALAALVVIVLIAYLISRNRNKGGYESV